MCGFFLASRTPAASVNAYLCHVSGCPGLRDLDESWFSIQETGQNLLDMRTTIFAALVCLAPQLGLAADSDICSQQLIPFGQAGAASAPSTGTSHAEQSSTGAQGRNVRIDAYLKGISELTLFAPCNGEKPVEGSYRYYRKWYSDYLPEKRIGSQFFAILTIILGALLPVLVQLGSTSTNYKLWVSLVGAAIVIAQGLGQSLHFDETWKGYMLARIRLEGVHRQWQQEVVDSSFVSDGEKALDRLQEATKEFDHAVATIVIEETERYFTATARARASGPR